MPQSIEQILAAKNLTGIITDVVGGVPDDLIPPEYLRDSTPVAGDYGTYQRVSATRKLAKTTAYGSKARNANTVGIGETPIKLLHTFEEWSHKPQTMMNLMAEGNEARQNMGAQTVARKAAEFGRRFQNFRLGCMYSAFARGKISVDRDGELQLTDQAATGGVDVDFDVPADHKDQFGGLVTDWSNAATKIVTQMKKIKKQARKDTGLPVSTALYGEDLPDYFLTNTQTKELINRSPALRDSFAQADRGEIPNGFLGLNWSPVDQAFYEKEDGTQTDFFGGDALILLPDADRGWWEWLEGSYPVPTTVGTIFNDASAALSSFREVNGVFSFASVAHNPPSLTQYMGDTVIPVLKNGSAIWIGDVKP